MKQTSRICRPSHGPCSASPPSPDPADPADPADAADRAIRAVAGRARFTPWREAAFEPVDPDFDEDGVDDLIRRNFESAGDSVDPEPQ